MSSRKPGYLIGVILLALMMSAPQIVTSFVIGVQAYQQGSWPSLLPGFGGTSFYSNLFTYSAFWRDKFLYIGYGKQRPDGVFDWKVFAIDPESGETTELDLALSGRAGFQPMSFGERLWFVGTNESFEEVDGSLLPSKFVNPRTWPGDAQRFLLNGEAAHVERTGLGYTVSTFKAGTWVSAGEVVLPADDRVWTLGKTSADWRNLSTTAAPVPQIGRAPTNVRTPEWMSCLNQGDRIHVFLHSNGLLLHREGLELQQAANPDELRQRRIDSVLGSTDEPVSALRAANTDADSEGWSLVSENPSSPVPWHLNLSCCMLVGGQPVALIVDDAEPGYRVGHLYRFDGASWSEFAVQAFPFGSNQFRVVCCRDGRKSFIVASTSTGAAHIYAVEATGIRATNGATTAVSPMMQSLITYAFIPVAMLVLGIVLGLATWFLMWRYTKPDYGFGVQTVKLASLGRRGLARLIDLGLILLTTAGLGWAMTRGFDWQALLEALNLQVDHPTIPVAARVASILAVWLAVCVVSLLVVQARSGVTPGKWLCGLRTLRTTLRPCGFARSLVRETVLCVDACSFFCWTPGIVSIALTDCRQRLGDLVADTIVVEAASWHRD